MDRVRASIRLGELVGMTLTDFEIREDDALELHFEDARVLVEADFDEDEGLGPWLDVEVR